MMYQLQTGKTVYIDNNRYFNMTDQDFQNLVADDRGIEINNPFYNKADTRTKSQDTESDVENVEDVLSIDLPDISDIEELELSEELD